ncbi:MAG: dihydrolipoamide acetyltransferase family protein [Jatrophihabitans sp.]
MPDFLLPDLGEGLTEAEIVAWRVEEGDEVTIDQVVVEVETAKAAVEIPVPFAGVVSRLHARAGETVAVGTRLISVGETSATVGFREPGVVTGRVPPADSRATDSSAADEGSGNVLIGYGTPPTRGRRRRSSPRPAAESARVAPTTSGALAVVSPLVRKRARECALDLHSVTGTGPAGLIMRSDVEQAVAAKSVAEQPKPSTDDDGQTRRIPLTGLRKVVADKLTRSRREIPEATVWVDVDATGLLAARAALNARDAVRPVSVLALVTRFVIVGLRIYPELNGWVEQDAIVLSRAIGLGFAAQTERGLVVPVIRGADLLSTRELSEAIGTQTASARAGSLSPADLSGGTFTVNNYGVFGVDGSAAIINHPEVAILGIGRIVDKPWVHDGELAIRKVTQLTLAFDHRVCDGGTAGGFLRFVADCVERPAVALGEI